MRKYLFFTLISIFIFSCSSKKTDTASEKDNDKDSVPSKLPELKVKTNNVSENENIYNDSNDSISYELTDVWVNEAYIKELLLSKSPRKAQDMDGVYLDAIIIYKDTPNEASINYGFHEGGEGIIVHDESLYFETGGERVKMEILEKDKRIKIGKETFIKCESDKNLSETFLFQGKYKETSNSVIFKSNGEVTGLNGYNKYSVVSDYIGPGSQVDQLSFRNVDGKKETYGFKFLSDSLFIYNLNCLDYDSSNGFCLQVEYGTLKYKLIKEK